MAYKIIGIGSPNIKTKLYRADTTADLATIVAKEDVQGLLAECEVVADGSYHKLNSSKVWVAQP